MTRKNPCGGQASTQAANLVCHTVSPTHPRRDGLTRQTRRKFARRFVCFFLARPVTRFSLKSCTSQEPTCASSSKIRFIPAGGSIERNAIPPPLDMWADLEDGKAIAERLNVRRRKSFA